MGEQAKHAASSQWRLEVNCVWVGRVFALLPPHGPGDPAETSDWPPAPSDSQNYLTGPFFSYNFCKPLKIFVLGKIENYIAFLRDNSIADEAK